MWSVLLFLLLFIRNIEEKRLQHRLQISSQGLSSPFLGTWERNCISFTLLYKRDDDARVLVCAWVILRVLARNLSITKREFQTVSDEKRAKKSNVNRVFVLCLQGHKNVNRAIIHVDEAKGDTYKLLVEGDDLLSVMSTVGKSHYYTITIYQLDCTFLESNLNVHPCLW